MSPVSLAGGRSGSVPVLMRGVLRGMGREVECEIYARKRFLSWAGERPVYAYSAFSIIEAPSDLPDGRYTAVLGDCASAMIRRDGLWTEDAEALPERLYPAPVPSDRGGHFVRLFQRGRRVGASILPRVRYLAAMPVLPLLRRAATRRSQV